MPTPTPTLTPTPTPEPTPTPTPAPTPTPTTAPSESLASAECPFDHDPSLHPDFECAYLTVPADYDDPAAGELELAVAIFRQSHEGESGTPLVFLDGGPGGNTLKTIPFAFDQGLAALAEGRDLIVFDQRGVGYSNPALDCPEFTDLTFELLNRIIPDTEALDLSLSATQECRDRLAGEGIDLALFDSTANAADVDRLRAALGYEQWDLLGVSYGTRLAQTVMRDYPEGVRRVVLDSAHTIEHDLYANIPRTADRAFRALFDACATDPACNEHYPNLERKLADAFATLNESPASGIAVDLLTGEPYDSMMNGSDLANLLFTALYSTNLIPWLPEIISLAAKGNAEAAAWLLSVELTNIPFISTGMHYSVQCQDELPFTNPEEISRGVEDSPLFSSFMDSESLYVIQNFSICDIWDVPASNPIENEPVVSDIPTLVLAGEFDPITPPSSSRAVASNLTNATFVEFPGLGHGVYPVGDCPPSIIAEFLSGADDPDVSCVSDLGAPQWILPLELTTLVPFHDEDTGLRGVRPEGWDEVAPSRVARESLGVSTITQTVVPWIQASALRDNFSQSQTAAPDTEPFDITVGEVVWEVSEFEAVGLALILAVADLDGGAGLVLVSAMKQQRDTVIEQLLTPILEAFEPPA